MIYIHIYVCIYRVCFVLCCVLYFADVVLAVRTVLFFFATISAVYNDDDFGVLASDGVFLSTPAAVAKLEGIL